MIVAPNIRIFVSTLALGQLVVVPAWAAASDCTAAVVVEGEGPAVATVVADLHRHGIAAAPEAGCPLVRAWIHERAGGIAVTIVDVDGRKSERTAHGTAAVASLIESWARTDVVAPLLAPHPHQPPVPAPLPHPTASMPPTSVIVMSEPSDSRAAPALSLTAYGETALATDGSVWFGLSVGACLHLGPACVGALARVTNDAGIAGDSQDHHTGRLATDVLVSAGLPIRRGRLTIMPGLAFGVGWMRTRTLTSLVGGDAVDVDSGGLRASATMRMSFNVSTSVALDLGIAAEFAPLAHTAPYDAQAPLLAGEPLGDLRGGLGIRIDVP